MLMNVYRLRLNDSPMRFRVFRLPRRSLSTFLQWPQAEPRISDRLLDIERHWKDAVTTPSSTNIVHDEKAKYILSMFPYPSGNLHMGHLRVYTISDVIARFWRQKGYKVIHPIGWDAFGLPAENAARERGVDPKEWTDKNISTMREQLCRTGVQFDWDREINTSSPSFFRWTQWLFLQLYEKGLVRRGMVEVNWDPVDCTVLAEEQIDAEGRSWRSGAIAEKKKMRTWLIETPKYAKELYDGLSSLSEWHEVADIQKHWIGPCDVYRFLFPVKSPSGSLLDELLDLRVPSLLSIASTRFVVLQQGHPLTNRNKDGNTEPYLSKLSVLNGVTGVWMPVVVVPVGYRNGDCPEMVLDARPGDELADHNLMTAFELKLDTRRRQELTREDVEEIAEFGGFRGYQTSRRIVDWAVNRQRGWGTPIPMIIDKHHPNSFAPVSPSSLPILTSQRGEERTCTDLPSGSGCIESDTLDTFFDSSWYYLRYLDPHNEKTFIAPEKMRDMPVDVYVGGVEHAAVHMFFARFVFHFLRSSSLLPPTAREPFSTLVPQGIVRGRTIIETETGRYLRPDEWHEKDGIIHSKSGVPVSIVFEKMSKSKWNGVDPLTVLDRDGVDLTRLQLLDSAAPRAPINWGDSDLKGLRKWLDRCAWVVSSYVSARRGKEEGDGNDAEKKNEEELNEAYNFFVRNVSVHLDVLKVHNTAIARLQGLTNALRKVKPEVLGSSVEAERCVHALVTMLQVFAPHIAHELWSALLSVRPLAIERAPRVDEQLWPAIDAHCHIDFQLVMNGISLGRPSVPRQQIESLTDDVILRRASSQEHRDIFDYLQKHQKHVSRVVVDRRRDYYVKMTLELEEHVDDSFVREMLDHIAAEKRRAAKSEKKKGKKAAK